MVTMLRTVSSSETPRARDAGASAPTAAAGGAVRRAPRVDGAPAAAAGGARGVAAAPLWISMAAPSRHPSARVLPAAAAAAGAASAAEKEWDPLLPPPRVVSRCGGAAARGAAEAARGPWRLRPGCGAARAAAALCALVLLVQVVHVSGGTCNPGSCCNWNCGALGRYPYTHAVCGITPARRGLHNMLRRQVPGFERVHIHLV